MNTNPDRIHLVIPAAPEYVLVVRLTTAGLATRAGMSFDDVEDLRVASAEMCRLLMGENGAAGSIALDFDIGDALVAIEAVGNIEPPPTPPADDDLSVHLLSALTDEHEVQFDASGARIRMVKRRRP